LRAFPAIELFAEFTPSPDITMIPFGLKTILNVMKGTRVVELGVDATYGTNSSGLECYAFMTEYDGAGLPLVYFLLSTVTSTTIGKRRDAIAGLAAVLRDKYDIHPRFFHTDKDMAQISAGKAVWSKSCKIQQCEWHMEHALTARFSDSKQSTTPYNSRRANREFSFIDINFKPSGTPDRAEHEGELLPEDETYLTENLDGTIIPPVESLKLKLPPRSSLLEVSGDTSDGSSQIRTQHEGELLPEDETYLTENLDGTIIPPVESLKLKLPPRSSLLEVSGDTSDGSSQIRTQREPLDRCLGSG
jgi:hypothetical protein